MPCHAVYILVILYLGGGGVNTIPGPSIAATIGHSHCCSSGSGMEGELVLVLVLVLGLVTPNNYGRALHALHPWRLERAIVLHAR